MAAVLLGLTLGGCGIVMPLSSWMSGPSKEEPRESTDVTGSIGKAVEAVPADTDADAVRRALEVASARGVDAPVAWKNEATGNSGTVTASTAARAGNGAPCRDFETTLVSISGVDLHSGRICQGYTGAWEVLRFDRVGG
ncbi:MAG: hypothetical protein GX458_04830 [Phyllobacteriaceae bacterium]|nr:hypothetical protein [Phyllobacteriaceae bacterium]